MTSVTTFDDDNILRESTFKGEQMSRKLKLSARTTGNYKTVLGLGVLFPHKIFLELLRLNV